MQKGDVPLFLIPSFQKYFSLNWTMLPISTPPVTLFEEEQQYEQTRDELVQKMKEEYASRANKNPYYRVVYDLSSQSNDSIEQQDPIPITMQPMPPLYTLSGPEDTTLLFESRFESGNLLKATQIFESEYDLKLQFDTNTLGHIQWFYFSVQNMKANTIYKFNIINLMKPHSLFNCGLLPVVFSTKEYEKSGKGWIHSGMDACYWENEKPLPNQKNSYYKTLTFHYQNLHSNDTVYFAHCYPYTFTDLKKFLQQIVNDETKSKFVKVEELCKTISGNSCPMLTITEPASEYQLKNRQGLVFSARVHPGESNSSWMMQGLIQFLVEEKNSLAQHIRNNYIVKVIPMVNIDGVIVGNYRCCVSGVDLNRVFKDPDKTMHPTVYHFSKMLKKFSQETVVQLFVDFHGHSKKKNIFMYGCTDRIRSKRMQMKLFPKMVASQTMAESLFSFEDCSFNLSSNKDQTARVVFYSMYHIVHSYTLEASFLGSSKTNTFFRVKEFEQMGQVLLTSLIDFEIFEKRTLHLKQLEKMFPVQKVVKESTTVEQDVAEFKSKLQQRMSSVANIILSPTDRTRFHDALEEGSAFSVGSDSDTTDHSIKKRKKIIKRPRKQNKSVPVEIRWKEPSTGNTIIKENADMAIDSDAYYTAVESSSDESDSTETIRPKQKQQRSKAIVLWIGIPAALFLLCLTAAIYAKNFIS